MCTLAVEHRPGSVLPLLVAANRDEALDRPSSGPALWPGPMPFVAPRDERALGTWLGVNAARLFVGITNRHGHAPELARASRGALVWEALGRPSASALHQTLTNLDPRRYNPFHLLYADAREAYVTWTDGQHIQQAQLGPGLHVVTERSFDAVPQVEREPRLRAAWTEAAVHTSEALEKLRPAMVIHDPETRLGGTCVHAEALNYGTRSSLLLALTADRARSRMLWAEGRPCEHPFVDCGELLRQLWSSSPRS